MNRLRDSFRRGKMATKLPDWADDQLESKFLEYNRTFNSAKVPEEQMSFRSFDHFIGNVGFDRIYRTDLFEVMDSYGKEDEGHKILKYKKFIDVLGMLFRRERKRRLAIDEEFSSEKELLLEVFKIPVKQSQSRIVKCLNYLLPKISGKELIPKLASDIGNTLKVVASTSLMELRDIGVTLNWISPVVTLLTSIWEHIEAYRKVPDVLRQFAATLTYLKDALVYIDSNELYSETNTKKRLEGLKGILEQSNELFEKASNDCAKDKKVKKFFAAEDHSEKLKAQEQEICNWMTTIYLMQLAENQKLNLDTQKEVKEVKCVVKELKDIIALFLAGIMQRGLTENGVMATVKEIFRQFNLTPPNLGVDVPLTVASQEQEEHSHQLSSDSPPRQAADEGANPGGPASYCVHDATKQMESMQMTPQGPVLQPPSQNSPRNSPSSRRVNGSNSSPNLNTARDEPDARVVPSAPPESLPPDPSQGTSPPRDQNPETTAEPSTDQEPTPAASSSTPSPPRKDAKPDALSLKDDYTTTDVLQWISDNFGDKGFISFARLLPGPARLSRPDIEAVEYELSRHHGLSERNMAILEFWQQQNPDQCNIDTLHTYLRRDEVGRNALAKKMREKFCPADQQVVSLPVKSSSGACGYGSKTQAVPLGQSNSSPSTRLRNMQYAPPEDSSRTNAERQHAGDFHGGPIPDKQYDFLLVHEKDDTADVNQIRNTMKEKLPGAEVAILADFHTAGFDPRPLQAGLEKTTIVAFYISQNTAKMNREETTISDLNFQIVGKKRGVQVFIMYQTEGAKVLNDLLKTDIPYLQYLADATHTYDVLDKNFLKKMNDWYSAHKRKTQARRK